jgi:hypothetical protein
MGPKICSALTEIEFQHTDVDYDANNGMFTSIETPKKRYS